MHFISSCMLCWMKVGQDDHAKKEPEKLMHNRYHTLFISKIFIIKIVLKSLGFYGTYKMFISPFTAQRTHLNMDKQLYMDYRNKETTFYTIYLKPDILQTNRVESDEKNLLSVRM